ncbi:DUF2892 domain-containing protein [Ammoniphilus sp. CFH 90114]|uniref:YgaP family membrane protein n=1 Tax=Ammoniphilus sp. CFH 90114 TaxID=2493665 RepID=UPI00100F28D7|nr:DUF2892 domain-containing protein [Ammoniphilus sp. CFH 90114]RXT05164.1 DUF2892 domain-containing protein [Ammoniphilus sp. CFH 90114]
MKKNVGTIDALLRISLGFFAFGWGISRMVRKPYSAMPFFITLMASQKIAEGITRFCPGLALLGLNTRDVKKERKMPPSTNYYARRKIEPPLTAPTQFERGDIHE